MNEKSQAVHSTADRQSPLTEIEFLIDLEYCFVQYWLRVDLENLEENKPDEVNFAKDYYLALDVALSNGSTDLLIGLLYASAPVPQEFLPMLGYILAGRHIKRGAKPVMPDFSKKALFCYMHKRKCLDKKKLGVIYNEISYKTGGKLTEAKIGRAHV